MRPPARTTRSARSVEVQESTAAHSAPRRPAKVASNRSSRTGTPCSDKEKKPRHRMTDLQLERLEVLYQEDTHPTREQKQALGDEVGMDTRTVTVWFQNRRQLAKKQSLIMNTAPQPMCRQPLSTVSSRNSQASRQPSSSSFSQSSVLERRTPQPQPYLSRQMKRELWEHLPSTPPSLPTSAITSAMPSPLAKRLRGPVDEEADKENANRKRKPILEWACARMAKRRRLQPMENMDDCAEQTEDEDHEETLVDFDDLLVAEKLGNRKDLMAQTQEQGRRLPPSGSLEAVVIPPEFNDQFDADVVFGASLLLTFQYAYRA